MRYTLMKQLNVLILKHLLWLPATKSQNTVMYLHSQYLNRHGGEIFVSFLLFMLIISGLFVDRGSFCLYDENLTVGAIAHLSSLACLKVCETAKCLPQLLRLELLPKCDVWPNGFKRWGPTEENIALYFFPNNER